MIKEDGEGNETFSKGLRVRQGLVLGLELKPQICLTPSFLCEVHLTRANSQVSELGSGSSSLSPAFRGGSLSAHLD